MIDSSRLKCYQLSYDPGNFIILSLAGKNTSIAAKKDLLAADLLISTLLLPISSYFFLESAFPMDSWCCLTWGIADSSLNFISTACLTLISVDRGLSIYSPIRYRVNRTATLVKVLLGILWILVPVLSGLILYILELSSDEKNCSLKGLHFSHFNRIRNG